MNTIEFLKILNPLLISIITVIGGAAIKFYFDAKSLEKKYKLEKKTSTDLKEEIKDKSISIQMDLETLNVIKNCFDQVLRKTKADRILILTATNGTSDLKFATAIYEHHKDSSSVSLSIGATNKYIKFEFDSEYKKMLKETEALGMVNYDVKNMRDCDLKTIYESEKINFSNVYFLMRKPIDEANDRLFYCSIAIMGIPLIIYIFIKTTPEDQLKAYGGESKGKAKKKRGEV